MKIKNQFKFIFVSVLSVAIVVAGSYVMLISKSTPVKTLSVVPDKSFGWKFPIAKFPLTGSSPGLLAYSDIRDPGGIPQGLPVRLKIPIIGVDSAIEDARITPDGRMDVPSGSVNVAWFALGPHPGDEGSAVIGGHYGIDNGVPFVFYLLDKLKVDDKVYIVDDKGDTHAFVIRTIKLFGRDDDAVSVFPSRDGLAHLNIITCEGIWNQMNGTYPERRVVFTDAIPESGALAPATAAFHRVLSLGTTGADVASLQTILEQKGFLTLPPGVAKGYFGALTQAAVTRYQTSVGLIAIGVFGSKTRAKLVGELGGTPTIPNTGLNEPTDPPSENAAPVETISVTHSTKDLFETPFDILVTSLLLVGIAFVVFKIVYQRKA